ncbi:MAG: hypothetical protein FWC73_06670 [Defluviitaleaceae bacterium]|nr:hypothetical protein [Defluviitaleaceae bacterium]
MDAISKKDRDILRELAKKQVELAHTPAMDALWEDWRRHGAFDKNSRPMIRIETGSFADDIIPQMLRCETEAGRKLEQELISSTINHEYYGDDNLVLDYLPINLHRYFVPFGIEIKLAHPKEDSLGHEFVPAIGDLEQDFHKLGKSIFGIEPETSQKWMDYRNEILGDILPTKISPFIMYNGPTQSLVHIMKMEDMYMAMFDYPELFHKMMDMLTSDVMDYFDLMEREGVLLPTTDECWLGQGSYCFSNELPTQGEGLKTTDLWGYLDSQESAGLSPAMFGEFLAPYYRRIAARYGLLSYGCCEAVDPIWDSFLSNLDNLRKVSVAPWANEDFMGERLQGKNIVYMRKPSPNYIGVGDILDEKAITAHIDATVTAAKGCHLEIIQRDVYKVSRSTEKVRRYVELIRNCCDRHVK